MVEDGSRRPEVERALEVAERLSTALRAAGGENPLSIDESRILAYLGAVAPPSGVTGTHLREEIGIVQPSASKALKALRERKFVETTTHHDGGTGRPTVMVVLARPMKDVLEEMSAELRASWGRVESDLEWLRETEERKRVENIQVKGGASVEPSADENVAAATSGTSVRLEEE